MGRGDVGGLLTSPHRRGSMGRRMKSVTESDGFEPGYNVEDTEC